MLPKIQSNTAIHVIEWSFESENPWLKNCDIVKYGWRRKWIQLKMIITRFYTPSRSGGLKANKLNWNLSFDILLFQQFLTYFNFCKFSNQGFNFRNRNGSPNIREREVHFRASDQGNRVLIQWFKENCHVLEKSLQFLQFMT